MLKDSIIKKIKEKGLKLTSQRLAIIEVLAEHWHLHPGASFVYQEGKKKKKGLSLSTTYATLNELSRHGIIKMLQFDRMENRFEGNLEDHVNLICERCKKIMDYKISIGIDKKKIAQKTGFSIFEGRLEYYGYCRDCQDEEGDKKGKTKKDL
jgi:Fur family transcriptional regulator, peroxide stress response regulator